jgi:hypothetical protein
LVIAAQIAIIIVANWILIYAAMILITPRIQTPMWLIVSVLLFASAIYWYGMARANPYYGTTTMFMPDIKSARAIWFDFRLYAGQASYIIAIHYLYFLPLSLAAAFMAWSWRRYWARDRWFRFES